ncbi:MAG: trypsin-like peptidase domain-containing protein [Saccharofermentans sp.]|nr:trypsin-like peptidase domain-containing protein [Saccharofermentans sp.]
MNQNIKKAIGITAVALCCSVAGGVAGAGGVMALDYLRDAAVVNEEAVQSVDSTLVEGRHRTSAMNVSYVDNGTKLSASEIYAANVNSTVGISTSVTTNYFGYRTTGAVAGSGFILTSDGYIITNYHVVDGGSDIKVTTYDDTEYDAELVGYDESNDIAVLKVDAKGLNPVVLGNSGELNVGDGVVAIGNPLGELTFSLTSGTVSALNRRITIENQSMNLIQTDCAINSGNSGGALFNDYGEVIGIVNAKYSGNSLTGSIDNIGFAIPISDVRDEIESIITEGCVYKPYIGVSIYNDTRVAQQADGAVVYSVEKGSPAAQAGLEAMDVITAVNGTEISGYSDLVAILSSGKEGEKVALTVERDGETIELTVTLGVRKESAI